MSAKKLKVALVHDYLNEFGGAERVLAALSEIYPNAPIYTIYSKKSSPAGKYFKDKKIIQSWFSYLPFADKLISPLRFLIPWIWGSFNFKDYDLVITSASWAITKGMRGAKKEVCYLHTPPRYLYGYDTARNWKNKWYAPAISFYSLVVNHFLRIYDFKHAQKPARPAGGVDLFIANSQNVGHRIEKFYRRKDYQVVHPPVDITKFKPVSNEQDYYLTGGRLTAAKNFDLIIKACQKAGVNLKIFGTGREEGNLKKLGHAEFLGRVSESELVSLYQNAKAFIVAQADEDFGITPVETAAAGTPTIAYRGGGYLETVIDKKTGLFFDELTLNSIEKAIQKFKKLKFSQKALVSHAQAFSQANFKKKINSVVAKYV